MLLSPGISAWSHPIFISCPVRACVSQSVSPAVNFSVARPARASKWTPDIGHADRQPCHFSKAAAASPSPSSSSLLQISLRHSIVLGCIARRSRELWSRAHALALQTGEEARSRMTFLSDFFIDTLFSTRLFCRHTPKTSFWRNSFLGVRKTFWE